MEIDMSDDTAKKLVKFIASNMWRQSRFLYPPPQPVEMSDPYGLLDLIKEEFELSGHQIDLWLCEAQGIEPESSKPGVVDRIKPIGE
jgi:hypothetical protein